MCLLDQFRSWLIGILLAAAVAGIVDEIKDALVITVVLLISATHRIPAGTPGGAQPGGAAPDAAPPHRPLPMSSTTAT
ncbi:hypothetical protein [Streptomyces sp. NPDC012510]|uniref:hypothetical protein n=1 Tax=Streptomyces sp. NPDC012510 TaxID=3364838 RepID=UPI0036ECD82A